MRGIAAVVAIWAVLFVIFIATTETPAWGNGQPLPEYAALEQRITALEVQAEYARRDWQAFNQETLFAACEQVAQAAEVAGAVVYRCRRAAPDIVSQGGRVAKVPVRVWINGQGSIQLTVHLHRGTWSLNGIVAG